MTKKTRSTSGITDMAVACSRFHAPLSTDDDVAKDTEENRLPMCYAIKAKGEHGCDGIGGLRTRPRRFLPWSSTVTPTVVSSCTATVLI